MKKRTSEKNQFFPPFVYRIIKPPRSRHFHAAAHSAPYLGEFIENSKSMGAPSGAYGVGKCPRSDGAN